MKQANKKLQIQFAVISIAVVMAIPAFAQSLTVTNGNFENPPGGTYQVGVPGWFSPTGTYVAWIVPGLSDGTQGPAMGPGGWIYQSLGTYNSANGSNLNWSFEQDTLGDDANNTSFDIRFYVQTGAFTGAQGTDIDGASGVVCISTNSYASLASAGLFSRVNSGTLNLSGLTDGTVIWVRIADTGANYAAMDNVIVSQGVPPATVTGLTATAGIGQVSLTWNASPGATNYNVERSLTNGSGYTIIGSSTGTNYTDTNLIVATTNYFPYYYMISAMNSDGGSSNSVQVTATPPVVNGGFDWPDVAGDYGGGADGNGTGVLDWFTSSSQYEAWIQSGYSAGTQDVDTAPDGGGWIYQSLGPYDSANGTNLNWSFQQVQAHDGEDSGNFDIRFYAQTGAFTGAIGTDINGASGVVCLSTNSFASLNSLALTSQIDSGSLDVSGLTDGTVIWVRIANTGQNGSGNGYAAINNVSVSQGNALYISQNPVGTTNYSLLNFTLTATAFSSQPINYQWYYIPTNGLTTNAVAGGTNATLTINEALPSDGGSYYLNVSNSLGSSNSAVANVQILARPASLAAINGGFELPALGANSVNAGPTSGGVTYWFDDNVAYGAWVLGSGNLLNGSQACEFGQGGYIYQPIGTYYAANGTNLDWTMTQVTTDDGNNSADFDIRFYAQTGSFYGSLGSDIEGASGIAPIGSDPTASFTSLNILGLTIKQNSGSLNLSGVTDGTIIWVRVENTGIDGSGSGYAPVDNVSVSQNSGQAGPQFILNPQIQTNNYNYALFGITNTATLYAEAISSQPINYQWYYISSNGSTNAVVGATNVTLTVDTSVSSGAYYLNASNGLGSTNSALAYIDVIQRPVGLSTVNGDFELPAYGQGSTYEAPNGVGVLDWYSPTYPGTSGYGYQAWILGSGRTLDGSQVCEFGANGWIYQPMGIYNAGNGTNLYWTFEQYGNTVDGAANTASFTIGFYYTTDATFTPAQGTDIDGAAGVTKIGSYDFNSMAAAGLTNRINTGTQDLTSVPNGAAVWIRISDDVADYSPIDNVFVSQVPVRLTFSHTTGGQFQLGCNYYYGTLLTTTNLITGPWTPVSGATLPSYTITPSAAQQQFYRVSIP